MALPPAGHYQSVMRTKRGPRRYQFTIEDVAVLAGMKPSAVRKLTKPRTHKKDGVVVRTDPPALDPTDLASVVAFIVARSPTEQARVAKLLRATGADLDKAATALGVSVSTLYRRST